MILRLSILLSIFFHNKVFCQNLMTISEGTLKVAGLSEEEFYFGLSEGDELVFNFSEVKGKDLKEMEILEYPNGSKFFDYEQESITNKSISITNTGIYKLRLKNTALSARVCRYSLKRIPANNNQKFNTTVYWKTKRDTTKYLVEEDYLVSKDTTIVSVIPNKVERVHSQTSTNGLPNRTTVQVTLPENVVSWSYYLGVGEDAEAIFQEAEDKANKSRTKLKAASKLSIGLSSFDPTGSAVLASLALNGLAEFGVPDKADNIQYWFATDYDNAQLFMNGNQFLQFEKGNGPLSYKRMDFPKTGTFYICLFNDNIRDGIDVHIRISAVKITENWGKRTVEKFQVKTWKEPYLKN
jgi:hypothetical protein